MSDFLLEIGTEEIPARMIADATKELRQRISELVFRERLASEEILLQVCLEKGVLTSALSAADIPSEAYASPRRIAVLVHGLAASQPAVAEQLLGAAAAHRDQE